MESRRWSYRSVLGRPGVWLPDCSGCTWPGRSHPVQDIGQRWACLWKHTQTLISSVRVRVNIGVKIPRFLLFRQAGKFNYAVRHVATCMTVEANIINLLIRKTYMNEIWLFSLLSSADRIMIKFLFSSSILTLLWRNQI